MSDDLILENLTEVHKEKLTNLYYIEEFCEQIRKNQNNLPALIDETFDYLKEAYICQTKKAARDFFKELLQNIEESQKKVISDEEDSQNEEDEDFSELNDLEGDEKMVEGLCEICLSAKNLTLHHAIPKLMLKRLKRKKKKAPVIYLKLCSYCHSKLHKTFPHAVLAKKYYLIEAVLDCEELKDYIADRRRYVRQSEK